MSDDGLNGAILSGDQIRAALSGDQPLISEYLDLDAQIQPNGFDFTLRSIETLDGPGAIGRDDASRQLPVHRELEPDGDGWWSLAPGPYRIAFNEIVHLPLDLMALGRPRSSLARSGVMVHTAVWDAGYHGRSTALLVVVNQQGFRVQRGARVAQLVFLRLEGASRQGYNGIYQGERIDHLTGANGS